MFAAVQQHMLLKALPGFAVDRMKHPKILWQNNLPSNGHFEMQFYGGQLFGVYGDVIR